jgi:hypothetical protein
MIAEQRCVIEVPFNLPQGVQNHPAIIISTNTSNEHDNTFVAVMITHSKVEDEFSFLLNQQMFAGNKLPTSYQARLHLVSMFYSEYDIITNAYQNVKMKEEHFHRMMDRIIRLTFGYKIPLK